jgi:GT2 family glycosyltransferase
MSSDRSDSAPRIAVIILTWNGRALTLECLESLEAVQTPNTEIIVVDNASDDGTVGAIRDEYGDGVTVIVNDANLGFSRGNNVGIEHAMANGADVVLLLNNDTAVAPDFLDELVKPLLEDPGIGITAPLIYYYTPRDRIWFAGGEIFLGRGTARHTGIRERDVGQYGTARDIDYATGCALMVRREVIERIGGLDPSYMAYFEDTDFCMRARGEGFRIRYVPAAKVWHKISASTGGQLSCRKILRKFRSTWRFFRRYAHWYNWLTIPFFFATDVLRIAFLVIFGRIRDAGDATPHTTENNQEKKP